MFHAVLNNYFESFATINRYVAYKREIYFFHCYSFLNKPTENFFFRRLSVMLLLAPLYVFDGRDNQIILTCMQ